MRSSSARQEQLDVTVKTIGGSVTGVRADSSKLEDLDWLYDTVKAEKGHVDVPR